MPENKHSCLLTRGENDVVMSLLGDKCQSLATTVVELYMAGGRSGYESWQLKGMGTLCLVKDNLKRSYFFRLYCPLRRKLIWEHEVYNSLSYITLTSYLYSFEAEDCIVAFNFANEEEGNILYTILIEKLENKRQRKLEKRQSRTAVISTAVHRLPAVPAIVTNGSEPRKTKTKGKLSKEDIGNPQNFRHLAHVGWDQETGFEANGEYEPALKEFFDKAGVSDTQRKDKKTMDFIYKFIEDHGGLEAVKTDMAPPVPARQVKPPPPPPPEHPPPPPPPPTRSIPPRPPAPECPPPPPPPPPTAPPLPPMMSPLTSMTPALPSSQPPPPPPPPPESRSALLDEIRSGYNLKPIGETKRSGMETTGGRDELMMQIKMGVKLNTVSVQEKTPIRNEALGGLAGALAKALANRSKVIHSDSSGSSDTEDDCDDDDWDE